MYDLAIRYTGGLVAPDLVIERTFSSPLRVGREPGCELVVAGESVSRVHLVIEPWASSWRLKDMGSANGTWRGEEAVSSLMITGPERVTVGREGATLELKLVPRGGASLQAPPARQPPATHAQAAAVGATTSIPAQPPPASAAAPPPAAPIPPAPEAEVRSTRALARALRRSDAELPPPVQEAVRAQVRAVHRRWAVAMGALIVLLAAVCAVAWSQRQRVLALQAAVQPVFYGMKQVELALASASNEEDREALQGIYDQSRETWQMFIAERDGARRYASPEERLVLRVIRAFGECDTDVPADFVAKVLEYVKGWATPSIPGRMDSTRFEFALRQAEREGYLPVILEALRARDLPPQFLYLAMQESNFDVTAVGPPTRYGFAKGMWQFIPETGAAMGLKIGPRADQPVYDELDARHDFHASTRAAADYIAELYRGSAQASGLLVMARYNWGEHAVGALVDRLPSNPRERNFWQLVERFGDQLPEETYKYVFGIVAAAVIGEEPSRWGFQRPSPTGAPPSETP